MGWKARERKCVRGNQYQYWVNTSIPTTLLGSIGASLYSGNIVLFPYKVVSCL